MARTLLALAGLGSAFVLGCGGYWTVAAAVLVVTWLPAVWWVRGELLATRAMMRGLGRHRKRHGPLDAAMTALAAAARTAR